MKLIRSSEDNKDIITSINQNSLTKQSIFNFLQAYELSTLTGTQVMLLVASETGHVYTFATRKLQPMITSDAGKALIQTCLNSPDPPQASQSQSNDQRMSAQGYEETELTYNAIADAAAAAEQQKAHNFDEQDFNDKEEEEIEISEQQHNQMSDEEDYHDYKADQQRRHRSVAQHRQGAGGVSGVPVAHPQLQHPLHPSAAAVMAGPSVHHQPLFSTTSSQGEFSQFENCSNYAKYGQTSVTFKTKYNWIVSGFSLPVCCVLLYTERFQGFEVPFFCLSCQCIK